LDLICAGVPRFGRKLMSQWSWSRVSRPDPSSRIESIARQRTERGFVIVPYEGKFRVMASCPRCQHKFFNPAPLERDAAKAAEYLGYKFDVHDCPETIEGRDRRPLFKIRPEACAGE
jgi:hypothetical protein